MSSESFQGQLRDPSLSTTAEGQPSTPVTLEIDRQGIRALPQGESPRTLAWKGMRLRRNDGGGFEFTQGRLTVIVVDPEILRVVESLAGNDLGNDLAALEGEHISGPWRTRLGCLFACIVVIWLVTRIPACFEAVTDEITESIPYSADESIGELANKNMEMGGNEITDPVVRGAVEAMINRIAPQRCLPDAEFQFKIVRNDTVNAFALPGGYITVFTGLLEKATTPEQVAGVIAHEIAHVTKRHGINRIVKAVGTMAVLAASLGDLSGVEGIAIEVLGSLTMNGYGRMDESEADREGVRMLIAALIDPEGLALFFESLAEEQEGEIPVWMSTHPAPGGRATAVRSQVLELEVQPTWKPLEIDWSAVLERLDEV